jgi:hypothetical protein
MKMRNTYILHSEVEEAVKEMWDKRATGDGDVPGMYSNCREKMVSK